MGLIKGAINIDNIMRGAVQVETVNRGVQEVWSANKWADSLYMTYPSLNTSIRRIDVNTLAYLEIVLTDSTNTRRDLYNYSLGEGYKRLYSGATIDNAVINNEIDVSTFAVIKNYTLWENHGQNNRCGNGTYMFVSGIGSSRIYRRDTSTVASIDYTTYVGLIVDIALSSNQMHAVMAFDNYSRLSRINNYVPNGASTLTQVTGVREESSPRFTSIDGYLFVALQKCIFDKGTLWKYETAAYAVVKSVAIDSNFANIYSPNKERGGII